MKNLAKFVVISLLLFSAINAEAVIISLVPSSQNVLVGDQFSLDVLYDTEGLETLGGAFAINFDDTAFDFVSVEFDSNLPDDPFFRVFPTAPVNSNSFNLGFGNFAGIMGSGTAATLLFQSSQEGNFDFTLTDPLPGHDSFLEGASYVNAQVQVTAPIPIPASAWLLLSALSSLGLMRRYKHSV